jgi:hypothetical protein
MASDGRILSVVRKAKSEISIKLLEAPLQRTRL